MTSGDSGLTHEVPAFPGYRVERELGSGGMATVYLAEDLKHRRRVAVKVIKPEVAQAIGGERFLKEIEVTARLSHPNILPLFDSGSSDGRLYYVMPFVAGGNAARPPGPRTADGDRRCGAPDERDGERPRVRP